MSKSAEPLLQHILTHHSQYLYKVYKVSLQASEYRKKQHHNWQIDKNIDKIQKFEK